MSFNEGDRVKVVGFWDNDTTFPDEIRQELVGSHGTVERIIPTPEGLEGAMGHLVGGMGTLMFVSLDEPFRGHTSLALTSSEVEAL